MSGTPTTPREHDDLDALYRTLDAQAGAPSAAVQAAVVREARRLAELGARSGAHDVVRPAGRPHHARGRWLGVAAAAALAGLAVLPLWRATQVPRPAAAPAVGARVAAAAAPAATGGYPPQAVRAPSLDLPRIAPRREPGPAHAAGPVPEVAVERAATAAGAAPGASARMAAAAPAVAAGAARAGAPGVSAALAAREPSPPPLRAADALRRAVVDGDEVGVRALAASGGVDARDARGRTALLLAAEGGQLAIVQILLANGADPNAADLDGDTPLRAALRAARADLVAVLRQAGAR
jgi:hypothetical protein